MRCAIAVATLLAMLASSTIQAADDSVFSLSARSRTAAKLPWGNGYRLVNRPMKWQARQTAVIVCDMWDLHHCLNATRRGTEMAPRMNNLLKLARRHGATIIHAPSSCMNTYKDHPARKRAQAVPKSKSLPD